MSDRNASYVRTQMLGPQTPPSSQIGAVRWVRENLFNGVLNSLLTLLAMLALGSFLLGIGPWLLNSVWNAHSLTQCREILQGEPGACWGVINDRWTQLLFGFYPSDLYWRPVLALLLMFVALAPVLFPSVPRSLIWFTLAYPFVAFWLIWGGSLWVPAAVLFGLMLAGLVMQATATSGTLLSVLAGLLMLFAVFGDPLSLVLNFIGYLGGLPSMQPHVEWMFGALPYPVLGVTPLMLDPSIGGFALRDVFPLMTPLHQTLSDSLPVTIRAVPSREFGGFMISIIIGVTGIALSLPLGILLALGRRSNMPLIKVIAVVFIEFIRGVPLITLLFTASLLLNYFLPPGTSFDLILRVIIMVTLFASAYMAEVIRGGLAALPRGQFEAADALGLDYWKAQRLIVMPQALKISIPGIVNTFIGLFKDTTLVVFIGLLDPIGLASAIRASSDWQGIYWELFIFIGAVFWIFCFSMSRYSMHLERRLKTDHR